MAPSRLGLTGGIGSGKTTVAACLVRLGGVLVDTDAIARSLTEPGGAAVPGLRAQFGAGVLRPDGSLDREAMRELVFNDAGARGALEALLHPMIRAEADAQAARAEGRWVVFDVPLLAQSPSWRARVDRIVVVDCPEPVQVQRVMARSGWSEQAVLAAIAAQSSRAQRRAIADAVVHNGAGTSMAQLQQACAALARCWHLEGTGPASQRR